MTAPNQTLLLGAGELGTAFLPYLSSLPTTHITVAVRDVSKYIHLSKPNVSLISLDYSRPSSTLAQTFAKHDTIISCTGFGQNGTQKKLTEAVLEAGKLRKEKGKGRIWYFPWQWGVNYDITKDSGGLMPLFGEQLEVRNTLRSQAVSSNIKWTIVSTGMFMSFLFEPFWGMVVKEGDEIVARALRSWEHKVTATDVSDIGKMLVEILARGNPASENSIVYIAGDTISYAHLAEVVKRVTGKKVKKEEWTIEHLKMKLEKDPKDLLKKYRVVFAGDGVWWDEELTLNHKLNIPFTNVETWAQKNLRL